MTSWTVRAQLHYKATDYEYRQLNLNPLLNLSTRNLTFLFYLVPDVNDADAAIHYIGIDSDGVITQTSQSKGIGLPGMIYQKMVAAVI